MIYRYWLARLDYDAGQYASAIRRLQDVVTQAPTFARAHDNLGLCYEALNQPDEAIPHYREAVGSTADDKARSGWPALNLGILLRTRGELEEAETLFREALTYDQHFAPGYYQLGVLLEQRGRMDDAVKALRQRGRRPTPTMRSRTTRWSRIYRRQGRTDEADAALATFQRLHDGPAGTGAVNPRATVRIGALLLALCVAAVARGGLAAPSNRRLAPRATLQRVAVLLERGDVAAASGVVEPALKAHPADPVLHNLAGRHRRPAGRLRVGRGALPDGHSPGAATVRPRTRTSDASIRSAPTAIPPMRAKAIADLSPAAGRRAVQRRRGCSRAACCWRSTDSLPPAARCSSGCRRRSDNGRRRSRFWPPTWAVPAMRRRRARSSTPWRRIRR